MDITKRAPPSNGSRVRTAAVVRSPETHDARPDAIDDRFEGDFKRAGAGPVSLQPSRRATPECFAHEQTEIERAGMDEQPLQDVLMSPQVRAPESTGVVHVGEGPLD